MGAIPGCPKKLKECPKEICPIFPCPEYNEYLDRVDKFKQARDDGWE